MLEKDYKKSIFDAHFHIAELKNDLKLDELSKTLSDKEIFYSGLTCAWSKENFNNQQNLIEESKKYSNLAIKGGFGIHPWYLDETLLDYLEQLLRENKIDFVGEAGQDFYSQELKATKEKQLLIFKSQIELCIQYKKPFVIHMRKSFDDILSFSSDLKKLPFVIFHSFNGNVLQARILLDKGINSYFSFGAGLLRGDKKALECVRELDSFCLTSETDAPSVTLDSIKKVYEVFAQYKKNPCNLTDTFLFN